MFIYGADTFSADKKIQAIKDAFRQKQPNNRLNLEIFDGDDFPAEKFRSSCLQNGFLGGKRLLIVKNFLHEAKTDAQNDMLELLQKVEKDEQNIIIFWEQSELDPKSALVHFPLTKFLLNTKKEIFDSLNDYQLKDWIKKYLSENDGQITDDGLNVLITLSGNNLWFLKNELDKLLANAGSGKITADLVNELTISQLMHDNIFQLSDELSRGRKTIALKLLKNQLDSGENESYLFAMIIRQFRIIQQLKHFLDLKKSEKEIAELTGLHPFVIKKTLPTARVASQEKLNKTYEALLKADRRLKGSNLKSDQILEMLILEI